MEIALALLLAKLLGTALEKVQLPAVLGGVFAGVVLGITSGLLMDNGISIIDSMDGELFSTMGEIGIIFLLFLSGMEIDVKSIKSSGMTSVLTAFGGVVAPFSLGLLFGVLFDFTLQETLVISTIMTATSVGITARTLIDMGQIRKRSSTVILSAAVIDDILGILVLTMVLGTMNIGAMLLRIAVFFFITLYLGMRIIGKLMAWSEKLSVAKSLVAVAIAICFIFSAFAHEMGIAAITGAFMAGLLIGQTIQSRRIKAEIETIASAFFIPIFFVSVGVSFDVSLFGTIGLMAVAFLLFAFGGKVIGAGIGARAGGLTRKESLQVGFGMMARLEVALVIVAAAMSRGVMREGAGQQVLTLTVLMVIVSTIITPIATKWAYRDEEVDYGGY